MKNFLNIFLKVLLSLIVTFTVAFYQKTTGPTYPKKFKFYYKENLVRLKLYRSYETDQNCPVEFKVPSEINGVLFYKIYPSYDNSEWIQVKMQHNLDSNTKEHFLRAELPHQPPAGKLQYFIKLDDGKDFNYYLGDEKKPIIIRFKGKVPTPILITHITFMFLALFFASYCGISSIFSWKTNYINITHIIITLICIFIGGLIFGPIVQKYAFGEYWTGFPYGKDLTDNKTLIMFLIWLITYLSLITFKSLYKKQGSKIVLTASFLTLLIYAIPHSMWGSQLDPKTGKILTGPQSIQQ